MSETLGALIKLVLQILGVAAVVLLLFKAFGSSKVSDAITNTTQLQTEIQSFYHGQNSFATLTDAVVINGRLAPDKMINGATLQNPWGNAGSVTVNVNAANVARFDITSTQIPPEACGKFVAAFNTTTLALSINGVAQALPVDVGAAVAACNVAANTVVLTFGH